MNLRKQHRLRDRKKWHYAARMTPCVVIMLPEKWDHKEPSPAVKATHGQPIENFLQDWINLVRATEEYRPRTAAETAAIVQQTRFNLSNAEYKAMRRGRLKILGGVSPICAPQKVPPVGTPVDITFSYTETYPLEFGEKLRAGQSLLRQQWGSYL